MEALRKCTKCGKEAHNEAELELFVKRKNRKYNRENYCYECNAKRVQKRNKDNPDGKKNSHLKNRYGITLSQYNTMFREQKGCCKICGTHQTNLTKSLNVDHCHTTGEVRGLLCHSCNTMLGLAYDNKQILKNAIEYLKERT